VLGDPLGEPPVEQEVLAEMALRPKAVPQE
jgi:hypothetical protein